MMAQSDPVGVAQQLGELRTVVTVWDHDHDLRLVLRFCQQLINGVFDERREGVALEQIGNEFGGVVVVNLWRAARGFRASAFGAIVWHNFSLHLRTVES